MKTKACVIHSAKDLRVEDVDVSEVGDSQVLVRIGAGGICGSDLHYYLQGGFGDVRIKQPMVLGHEVAGTVEKIGAQVTKVKPGDRIAVNPSRPCGHCEFCLSGNQQHCTDMWFYGSAMRIPHSQGAFRQYIVIEDFQCEPVGNEVSLGEAACCEPLAVALHAVRRAGEISGKKVLVTGSGPIGCLVIAAAKHAGALEVIATDVHQEALDKALAMGATGAINVSQEPGLKAERFTQNKGYFDIAIECTGAPSVLHDVIPAIYPKGTIVQVGMTGDVPVPIGSLVSKEIRLQGAFRFHKEYALAAKLLKEKRINVKPIITATFPLDQAVAAFEAAADRKIQSKVQLLF